MKKIIIAYILSLFFLNNVFSLNQNPAINYNDSNNGNETVKATLSGGYGSNARKIVYNNSTYKYGVRDESGHLIIPCEYYSISYSCLGTKTDPYIFVVSKYEGDGVIDWYGNTIISTERGYSSIFAHVDFKKSYTAMFSDKYSGKYIPTAYFEVWKIDPKHKNKRLKGICDINGFEVIEPLYYYINLNYRDPRNYFSVAKTRKDMKKNNYIDTNITFDIYGRCMQKPVKIYDDYKNYKVNNYIYVNAQGLYNEIKRLYSSPWISHYDKVEYDEKYNIFYVRKGNFRGVNDEYGHVIIPVGRKYTAVSRSVDGKYYTITKNPNNRTDWTGGYYNGACDAIGQEIIPPKYHSILYYKRGNYFKVENEHGHWETLNIGLDKDGVHHCPDHNEESSTQNNNRNTSNNNGSICPACGGRGYIVMTFPFSGSLPCGACRTTGRITFNFNSVPYPQNFSYPVAPSSGGTYDINSSGNNNTQGVSPTAKDCPYCNGRGRVIRDHTISTFGNDTQVYCSECNRSYYRSSGHSHADCSHCNGTGKMR